MYKNFIHALAYVTLIIFLNTTHIFGKEQHTILKDIYLSLGVAKSFPQSRITSYTYDDHDNHYTNQRLKNANIYRAAIGKKFNNLRAEFEYLYSNKHRFNNSYKMMIGDCDYKFYTSHKTYFINAYYDFKDFHNRIKPYIGTGIGISQNTISDKLHILFEENMSLWQKKTSTHFAYNGSLGILVEFNKRFYVDFCYKYMNLGKLKSPNIAKDIANNIYFKTPASVNGALKTNVLLMSIGINF